MLARNAVAYPNRFNTRNKFESFQIFNPRLMSRWHPVVAYRVVAIQIRAVLLQITRAIYSRHHQACHGPRRRPRRTARQRRAALPLSARMGSVKLADLIHQWLHGGTSPNFRVPLDSISIYQSGDDVVGSIGVLRTPRLRGRCVRVIAEERHWDQRAIASALEQNRYFADGCYYVNAMFCLSRRFGSTEAPCERWIGGLTYLFHPVQGPTMSTLVQRLRARAAGVRGNGADEAFVERLAQELNYRKHGTSASGPSQCLKTFSKNAHAAFLQQAPVLALSSMIAGDDDAKGSGRQKYQEPAEHIWYAIIQVSMSKSPCSHQVCANGCVHVATLSVDCVMCVCLRVLASTGIEAGARTHPAGARTHRHGGA